MPEKDQDNSTSVPAKTFAGKDIDISSNINIVELSSIDYMLPAFQPITYKGRKDICEMLDLTPSDSKNCSRNEITP